MKYCSAILKNFVFADILQEFHMKIKDGDSFLWESEVRGYELDAQGIVNNANYFHYFDHVRIQHFFSKGIDWKSWHDEGHDLVLAHVDLDFKSSLKAHDKFYVISKLERVGKLRIVFQQSLFTQPDDRLVAQATNTVACVSRKNGKPCMPKHLEEALFG
jgi:acyl-CoA thioester hydrolase